ncbi:MAG: homoserine dehydrogenase, partial [Chloroflexi bacterium]|nr:homoserine dehydrogenase [Chloroflexota bacterium]
MTHYSLALIGFGNVGRALTRLLTRKSAELRDRYGIEWRVTGIAARRRGIAINADGLDVEKAAKAVASGGGLSEFHTGAALADIPTFIRTCGADVLFEVSSLNPQNGEPALSYIRAALKAGMHVVTANKGPLVHGYHELRELAAARGRKFRFEATVIGGAPIFSLFRETLPAANLLGFRGILNS